MTSTPGPATPGPAGREPAGREPAGREPAGREPAGPSDAQLAAAMRTRRRAAPRYRAFIGVGVLVGFVAAFVVTAFADTTEFEASSVLGYTAVLLALVGGLLGGGVAVLLDGRR